MFVAAYEGYILLTQAEKKLEILGVILFFHNQLVQIVLFRCVRTIPGCHTKEEQQGDSLFEELAIETAERPDSHFWNSRARRQPTPIIGTLASTRAL